MNVSRPSPLKPVITAQSDISTTVKVDMPGFNMGSRSIGFEDYSVLSIPKATIVLEAGMPQLPKDAFSLIIPDEGEMSMRILDIEYIYMDIGTVLPSKGNLKRNVNPEDIPYTFGDVYEEDAYYPKSAADLSDAFIIRDFRGITVTLYPIQYNPAEGKLRIVKSITVEVYRSGSGGINILNRAKRNPDAGFNEIYSNFFINYDHMNQSKYPFLSDAAGNMLIISASGYMDNLSEWIYWKQKKGIDVELVNVSTIGNNSTDIKNYIQNKYNNEGVTWVVLVGNGTDVATISGSYDNTCDPVYSYLAGGDNYPDCYIARVSGNSETNIDIQMEKFIDYERYPQDGAHWYHRAIGTATTEGSPTDEERLTWVNDTLLAYTYTSASHLGESWADNNDVLDSLNNGNSILNHIGHGNQTGFGTSSAFWITITDIAGLSNTDMLTFAYMCACQIGDFDGVTTCLTESWMWTGALGAPTGGIGIYGSSVNQSWIPPTNAQLHANGLLKREETTTMGGMAYNGAMYMLEVDGDLEMLETWHIFGDPSIDLFTDTPDTLEVVHDSYVPIGPYSFSVTVTDDNTSNPIEGALVCAWGRTDTLMHVSGYSNASGIATLSIDCSTPGDTVWVTATKHNYHVYEGYCIVGADAPSQSSIIGYFDYSRIPELYPTLTFSATDGENDDLRYRILIDDNPLLSSPDSFTTGLYTQGESASYTLPSPLGDNTTYWWKVKAQDQNGSGYWGAYSGIRCFTVSTMLGNDNCSWYSCCQEQHQENSFINVHISGDSMLLNAAGQIGTDTLVNEDFEDQSAEGFTVTDGDSDGLTWGIYSQGQTYMSGYEPPSCGSYYAYYNDDAAGNGHTTAEEYLWMPVQYIGVCDSLWLSYGWGFREFEGTEILQAQYRIYKSGAWGSWTVINTYTTSGNGTESINLTGELPCDSLDVVWIYDDGGAWGYGGIIDNILLIRKTISSNNEGEIITPAVSYDELYDTYTSRTSWGNINWKNNSPDDSILLKVEYLSSGSWALIPDLTGNSDGFTGNPDGDGYCTVNIDGLNTSTYDSIRAHYYMYRKGTKSAGEPSISAIEIGNLISSMTSVKMVNMSADYRNGNVMLKWETVGDCGTVRWIVQRKEGSQYNDINSMDSDRSGNYTYKDSDIESGREYVYRVVSVNSDNIRQIFSPVKVMTGFLPTTYALMAPNPSIIRNSAVITYHVPRTTDISIDMYDISGRHIDNLYNGVREQGIYRAIIKAENIPSGTYFIIMKSEDTIMKEKATVIK